MPEVSNNDNNKKGGEMLESRIGRSTSIDLSIVFDLLVLNPRSEASKKK